MGIFTFFRKIKTFKERAEQAVREHVPSYVLSFAIAMAREAEHKLVTDEDKRNYVIKRLTDNRIKENVARLAVELAVLLIKNQQV